MTLTFTMPLLMWSSGDPAFGPLVLGPLSEIYGRIRVLQSANLFYLS